MCLLFRGIELLKKTPQVLNVHLSACGRIPERGQRLGTVKSSALLTVTRVACTGLQYSFSGMGLLSTFLVAEFMNGTSQNECKGRCRLMRGEPYVGGFYDGGGRVPAQGA